MKDIRFSYNYRTDELFIGINCYGICGDADGDGDPSVTSDALKQVCDGDIVVVFVTALSRAYLFVLLAFSYNYML